jgi:hypothetical protein
VFIAGILQETHAAKTYVARFADDHVVQQRNIEELPSVAKLPRNGDVFRTWGWVAARMVVGDDDAHGTVLHRFTEQREPMSGRERAA